MAEETTGEALAHCVNCGFEAPRGSGTWNQVDHQPLGSDHVSRVRQYTDP